MQNEMIKSGFTPDLHHFTFDLLFEAVIRIKFDEN